MKKLTDIEFKLIREDLHLAQCELADLWGVNIRTIQRWERGQFEIPDDRAEALIKMHADVNKAVNNFLQILEEKAAKNLAVLAYNQWSYDGDFPSYRVHYACLIKCKNAAAARGYNVRIVKFKPEEYREWLGTKEDTQAQRALWAALQF